MSVADTKNSTLLKGMRGATKETDSINMLLFSVGGVFFGVDADQVVAIDAYEGEKPEDLLWFHEVVGYGAKQADYHSPNIVSIRTGTPTPRRVIIDSMEDIAECSQNNILPFPALMEPFAMRKGMWGILVRHEQIVLLFDFMRLWN